MVHGNVRSGTDGADSPDDEHISSSKMAYIAEAIEMWEEKVNQLARNGEYSKLSEALKKVALKNRLVGKIKGQLRVLGVRQHTVGRDP